MSASRWVPIGPEGLPHHLDQRRPKDRRCLDPDIPADVVVAILWVEPSLPGYPGFYLPSVWMNGAFPSPARFLPSDKPYTQEKGAMKAALDIYKANLPSPPAHATRTTRS